MSQDMKTMWTTSHVIGLLKEILFPVFTKLHNWIMDTFILFRIKMHSEMLWQKQKEVVAGRETTDVTNILMAHCLHVFQGSTAERHCTIQKYKPVQQQ